MSNVEMAKDPFKVTVLEDEVLLRDLIVAELEMDGFSAKGCANAAEFWRHIALSPCDIVILDVGLPDESGFTIARDLRRKAVGNAAIGIIILSGYHSDEDRIRGLLQGADMYLIKPMEMGVLMASVGSLARRLEGFSSLVPRIEADEWCLVSQGWALRPPLGGSIALNAHERCLLLRLAAANGDPVSRDTLIAVMAEGDCDFDSHRLEMVIYRLRKKVSAVTFRRLPLEAVRGMGYLFRKIAVEESAT